MQLDTLTAISPIDGRYRSKCEPLADYFSEYALIRYRVRVEVEYFIALCEIPLPQLAGVDHSVFPALRAIYTGFTEADAAAVKEIERTTNHDVKAVEYFLKQRFDALGLEAYKEFIHFGLTSQDINNTAVPMSIREALHNATFPCLPRPTDSPHRPHAWARRSACSPTVCAHSSSRSRPWQSAASSEAPPATSTPI